jgi:hypothetical protein
LATTRKSYWRAAAIRALGKPEHVLYDLKYLLPAADSDLRLETPSNMCNPAILIYILPLYI